MGRPDPLAWIPTPGPLWWHPSSGSGLWTQWRCQWPCCNPLGSDLEQGGCTSASWLRCPVMGGQAQWPHGEQGIGWDLQGKKKEDKQLNTLLAMIHCSVISVAYAVLVLVATINLWYTLQVEMFVRGFFRLPAPRISQTCSVVNHTSGCSSVL